ncbi:hypothetical protein ENBRE01_0661 [Enteropsectra breve]|nr:hypothetical protein ENBRE01_0661 [Enteropsectra breve]
MELNREFLHNAEKKILLVCDYYETEQIPKHMLKAKESLAMFPVANVVLIEIMLLNFMSQNFFNVIIAGRNIDGIISHLKKRRLLNKLNIRTFHSSGNTFGDMIREIDLCRYDFKELIYVFVNHFTNISLAKLLKKHHKRKDPLVTVYAYPYETNHYETSLYAVSNEKLVFYDKILLEKIYLPEINDLMQKYDGMCLYMGYSRPSCGVLSKDAFAVFSENFDYNNIDDFIKGVLASQLYENDVALLTPEHFLKNLKDEDISTINIESDDFSIYRQSSPREEEFYGVDIITLLDYYKLNKELVKRVEDLHMLCGDGESLLFSAGSYSCEECGNSPAKAPGSLVSNCIIWDKCILDEKFDDCIVISSETTVNIYHLEVENAENDSFGNESQAQKGDSFFDDVTLYLLGYSKRPCARIDLIEVSKQINLLRIVWNATRSETIEAFACFFAKVVSIQILEASLEKASIFFAILPPMMDEEWSGDLLMDTIYENILDIELGTRAQIIFNYGYLLVKAGIIKKSVVKKYSKKYSEGSL